MSQTNRYKILRNIPIAFMTYASVLVIIMLIVLTLVYSCSNNTVDNVGNVDSGNQQVPRFTRVYDDKIGNELSVVVVNDNKTGKEYIVLRFRYSHMILLQENPNIQP